MTREEFLRRSKVEYSDWFGTGDSLLDFSAAEKARGKQALNVYVSEYMLLIDFGDVFMCNGYDGNEYRQTFIFEKLPVADLAIPGNEVIVDGKYYTIPAEIAQELSRISIERYNLREENKRLKEKVEIQKG
jgi:hypothetical protein